MNKPYYIGLMSGTSLDSIDAVIVRFQPAFELLAHTSAPIPDSLRAQVLKLTQPGHNEIDLLGEVDLALGRCFATAARQLLEQCAIPSSQVRAIGSHGQTIRHRPESGFTLQIGDPNTIAEHCGITTVADFRRRDMAAGGQGAPLVPAFHRALFSQPGRNRIILNIGGMANLTWLPADTEQSVTGYDTGPGNVLMDAWIGLHAGKAYDRDGCWAASGQVDNSLLSELLSLPYFSAPAPKSTGREQFNLKWLQQQLTAAHSGLKAEDIQATLLELTARSAANEIRRTCQEQDSLEIYLCGGGSHNSQLLRRIRALLPGTKVATTSELGLSPDWVEAAAFAWLASRTMHSLSGNEPGVTGACDYRILGAIYPA
ncbi:anhydro-N-acetylmuramic acid kinase [Marinobacterium jannaschii]|uniref:anhydro-N-acetylmuramic acid kinase n=1 Tax=Marinobacterium jannaschii TaxID=64970 RepID=UPI000487DE74|nr:anhydro-N-acetylmuramic acid kinase [Marinobacterium jannaschii]